MTKEQSAKENMEKMAQILAYVPKQAQEVIESSLQSAFVDGQLEAIDRHTKKIEAGIQALEEQPHD